MYRLRSDALIKANRMAVLYYFHTNWPYISAKQLFLQKSSGNTQARFRAAEKRHLAGNARSHHSNMGAPMRNSRRSLTGQIAAATGKRSPRTLQLRSSP